MSKHDDFIFRPIIKVLENSIDAISLVEEGIESYLLNDYIMSTIFIQMTGFQEQKFKCIAWELATENYNFRRDFLKNFSSEGFSTYKSKTELYKKINENIGEYQFSDQEKDSIIENTLNRMTDLIENSPLKSWNEPQYNDFKKSIKNNVNKKHIVTSKSVLLESSVVDIYKMLYKTRNRLAHNTTSYQRNLPELSELRDAKFGYNNFFVWFYILIIIDEVMITLYEEFKKNIKFSF